MIRLVLGLWWGCVTLAVSFFFVILLLGLAKAEYDRCAWMSGQAAANCYAAERLKIERGRDRETQSWRDAQERAARLRESNRFTQDFMNQTQVPLVPDAYTYPQYR